MKRILSYICTLASAALLVAGCVAEPAIETGGGKGRLTFDVTFNGEIKTRALVEAPENTEVKIGRPGVGYTHIWSSFDEVPEQIWLTSGSYFIEVTAGTPAAPGFTENLMYSGYEEFTITDGGEAQVAVECRVSTTLVTIGFDETVPEWLTDYKVTLQPAPKKPEQALVFDEDNAGSTAWFDLAKDQTEVAWKFEATHKNEAEEDPAVLVEGKFAELLGGKHYKANFTYTYSEKEGRLVLVVTVDETTDDIPTDIIIYQRPVIEGHDFDTPMLPEEGKVLRFIAPGDIVGINMSGSIFGAGYEVVGAADLADYGIAVSKINKGYEMTLSWEFFELVASWEPETRALASAVTIVATSDATSEANKIVTKVLDVEIPEATTLELKAGDAWATHAYVAGRGLDRNARFAYRQTGSGEWLYVAAALKGTEYAATLTGLTPETAYEYDFEVGGELVGQIRTFTTGAIVPLYNGGFENWYTLNEGKGVQYPNESGTYFWDSGNKGTATGAAASSGGGVSITTQANDPRPGSAGSSSAKLQSNWFGMMGMGAFAAGNLYTGEFLSVTASLSNPSGKVRFGRPFIGRPTAMNVWYKGSTGTVNYAKNGAPISVGEQDQYQILVALVDGNFPRDVDTADWNTIFKWDTDPDIIAFGEIHGSDAVDWTEARIPLTYRSTTRVPTHIVVLACASRYGDYFAGSTSSVLYVDDFELVYDENVVVKQ